MVSETLYHNDSETEEETFFYLLDGNGDVRALADEAGNVTDTYRFDAFGIKLIQTGNTKNPYGYRSEETDELTGFVYLRARYMNPATGTFISEDTFGGVLSSPITLNRYAYAGQNPVNFVDPSGHFFLAIKQVVTLTIQEMLRDYEGTMAAGRLGAFTSVMGAIVSGDSDLGWAYIKGYARGVGTAGLGKLKELGQGIRAAKQLYMVITLVRVFKNGSLAAYSFSKKDYAAAAFYGSLTVFGVLEYRAEAKALFQMNQTSVNNGDIKSHLYYNPDKGGSKSISYKDYDNIYQKSIHNPGKEKVMLGKYDGGGPTSYITKAGDEYTYFSLGSEWDAIKGKYGFTDDDMFKLFNEGFLDDGIYGGKTFYFSHNPINDRGALGMEYEYLLKNNYIWNETTMTMKPR